MNDWQTLVGFARNASLQIERVRIPENDLVIEGKFEMPPLARLSIDDQLFVAAFVRSHGSIKSMESLYGISYPTVKSRLNRIAGMLDFVDIDPPPRGEDILDRLERGEISVDEAENELRRSHDSAMD